MKYRRLGKSEFQISEIGLGCWQLGGDFGPVNDARAEAILRAAHGQDVNFWDTADVYGGGMSETRIGSYLHNHHADVVVATKVGRDASLFPDSYRKETVRRNIESSLRRLDLEALDLVQLHCVPREVLRDGDLLAWMEDFRSEGLVRHFGASVETLEDALFAVEHPSMASLQIIFSLFRQDAARKLFSKAEEHDTGIIVRLPLASGILAGKMSRQTAFDPSDHRHYNRNGEFFSQGETFSGIPFEDALDLVEELRNLKPRNLSMAQMAMRWILDHPAVSTIITGASRPEQVIENASVSALQPLPAELHKRLADFYDSEVAPRIVVGI